MPPHQGEPLEELFKPTCHFQLHSAAGSPFTIDILGPEALLARPRLPQLAIERCFGKSGSSAEAIVAALESEGTEWAAATLKVLRRVSPTSVKISLEAIERHRSVSLKEAFTTEYRMSQWCMRPQPSSDFCEGIRAVLVDKDNRPSWVPACLEDVSPERVEGFFAPLAPGHPRGELRL